MSKTKNSAWLRIDDTRIRYKRFDAQIAWRRAALWNSQGGGEFQETQYEGDSFLLDAPTKDHAEINSCLSLRPNQHELKVYDRPTGKLWGHWVAEFEKVAWSDIGDEVRVEAACIERLSPARIVTVTRVPSEIQKKLHGTGPVVLPKRRGFLVE